MRTSNTSVCLVVAALLYSTWTIYLWSKSLRSYGEWRRCMKGHLDSYSPQQWENHTQAVKLCSSKLSILKPSPFKNKDETKYAYLASPEEESVFITIGIGNDVDAEEKFREQQPKTKFYGADPIVENNEDMYSKFGEFFPFAIGKDTTKSIASVYINKKYVKKPMFHLNMVVFIKYLVKQRYIDHLWLDAERAEYGLFDMFLRNGDFERENIVICQVNMETHVTKNPEEDRPKFTRFINLLVQQGKYIIVDSVMHHHNRLFFVNVEDQYCTKKFNIAATP